MRIKTSSCLHIAIAFYQSGKFMKEVFVSNYALVLQRSPKKSMASQNGSFLCFMKQKRSRDASVNGARACNQFATTSLISWKCKQENKHYSLSPFVARNSKLNDVLINAHDLRPRTNTVQTLQWTWHAVVAKFLHKMGKTKLHKRKY